MNINIDSNLITSLIVGLFVGASAAYLGSIMVLRRLALVGDALTHVALPGMGVALVYEVNPFFGAFAALLFGILIIWQIENLTTIPTEAIVGIIFSLSLAVGILVTPEPELLEALFGDISSVQFLDGLLAVVFSALVFSAMYFMKEKLILGTISSDFAKSQNINTRFLDLAFLMLIAVVVALGVKVVGTLLMGSLVVIPAVASKNIARNFKSYSLVSVFFGIISAVTGIYLAALLNFSPGPMVVLASGTIFLTSLFFKRD